ncbi:hypothetical protein Cob_v009408 [Colletotrichum orbiculare MAFF 240422]|uniref:Uncharacterized protein n=1 Tax=Colletotrichum orbiculare (strain 104-T / ATCC 96160 / CBS 514.97 / LARS 414 / MAFF 240422) TaxID=1213857 RepID=A0A484FG53_COLOR|nr:hypothetical protein Cob_v009408 [Colletotrichum orbiculare MAFF 240422]
MLCSTFSGQAREARIIYLSCLTSLVVLVVFFAYSLLPRFDIRSVHLIDSHENHSFLYDAHNRPNRTSQPQSPTSTSTSSSSNLEKLKYAIILPTYSGHFPLAIKFFQSLMCLCTDHNEIDIHVVVSDSNEAEIFRDALDGLAECGERFSIFPVPPSNVNGPKPKVNIVNVYDILPPTLLSTATGNVTGADTSALLKERGKFQYQTIKKLAAAIELQYDWALWLDSEAIVVRPFSLRQTFDTYIKTPTIWRSRMTNNDFMRWNVETSAKILNRDLASFGERYWNLESVEWIVEKAIITDLVKWVEKEHREDFWTAWVTGGGPFEVNLYNMHLQARKLETTDALFTKYTIIETEREMERFGLGPAKPVMDQFSGTGLLERGYRLLQVNGIAPGFSAMLRNYGQRLFRMDDLDVAPPDVIDRFLLDTPLDILCSGAPPVHEWWAKRNKSIVTTT